MVVAHLVIFTACSENSMVGLRHGHFTAWPLCSMVGALNKIPSSIIGTVLFRSAIPTRQTYKTDTMANPLQNHTT